MATIQPNSGFLRPAQMQAERLQNLPDKTAYNEFVDSTLQCDRFRDTAPEEAKTLAAMARSVATTLPDSQNRFQFLKTCFDSALSGSVASAPGGPAAVMAKAVLDLLPNLQEDRQSVVAAQALDSIALRTNDSEARDHADLAFEAGRRAGKSSASVQATILISGLGVIADLGQAAPTQPGPEQEKAQTEFLHTYQGLDCKAESGMACSPTQMKDKPVVLLVKDAGTGEMREVTGRIQPQGASNTALFTLSDRPEKYNSNEVLGLVELPWFARTDSVEDVRSNLQIHKERNTIKREWASGYEAQGHDTCDIINGLEMTGRQVAFLQTEEDGSRREYSGVVTGTDPKRNAIFSLEGQEREFNSNDLLQVAFLDGRRP
jgi:hypothetical protein